MTSRYVLSLLLPELIAELRTAGFIPVPWPATEEECRALIGRADDIEAVVTHGSKPLPKGFLDTASRLGLIACVGAGYENYDPATLRDRGVALVNGAGLNGEDVADLAIGLFIAAQRHIVEADAFVRSGRWHPFLARRIRGRHLGVLGLGAIGHAVAVRGQALGMTIGWWGPNGKPTDWQRFPDPLALAAWADVLMVCCRPTPDNKRLVNAAMLDALGAQGVLVNVARGSLVDEDELSAALKTGRIAAAALDVFAEEPTDPARWQDVPNLTLHPHSGGATYEALADGRAFAIENLRRHFAGEPLRNLLN